MAEPDVPVSVERPFLGTGWGFPPEFHGRARETRMVSGAEDIREALWILLSTAPGERVMQPTFGCGLRGRVFETIDGTTLSEIRELVERAVLFFEPRITLDAVEIEVVDELGGEIHIDLRYTIRETNTRANMVYPFYVLEGTNVRTSS